MAVLQPGFERLESDPFAVTLRSVDRERMGWEEYQFLAQAIDLRFEGALHESRFRFTVPTRLQRSGPVRFRREYEIPVAYTVWGAPSEHVVVALGGVANSSRRFDFLAHALGRNYRVLCPDWIGRGRSGWAAHVDHYGHELLVEQVVAMLDFVRASSATIVGSSLGGAVAIAVAARYADRVRSLVLNDFGPFLPVTRRRRRSQALERHYVFRSPRDVFRRGGASQKNDGPVGDDVLLHNTYHQTKWSEEEGGRVYRHDPRSMAAFARDARESLDMWDTWSRVRCPVFVLRGELSDALLPATVERMQKRSGVVVADVPETGHTPALSDPAQIAAIEQFLADPGALPRRWPLPYAEPLSSRKLFT